jgi:hypothetical protein
LAELCIKHNLLPTDEYLEALELMEFVQINRGNDMTDKTVQATPELPVSQQLLNLVEAQAQDGGLWFEAKTAPEAYLQQELRKLHAAIEARAIQAMPELPELPVVAWLTGAGILTSNFFYKESWIPKPVDQPLCKVSDALTYAESLRSENADLKKRAYFHPENHSKTLQQIFYDLHLFEEVAEHYAQCGMSPESMRNWVVDKNTEVDQLKAELEAARAALKPLVAEPVYVQVRHKTEYGMSEWGVPLDPKEQHSTWADGVEMRLLYTTPPFTSIGVQRHKFWGAGEPDCPRDIKAPNGELYTMRCKVCGDDWRKSRDVCFAATNLPSTSIGGEVTDDVKYECDNAAWAAAWAEKKWYSSRCLASTKPADTP